MVFLERILIGKNIILVEIESLFLRDACMTWTLDNGTIVMQNFVNKDQVKSFSKLKAFQ